MVYQPKFPQCPYRSNGGNHCSHKNHGKCCSYVQCPEKCDLFNEWVETREYTIEKELSLTSPLKPSQEVSGSEGER